jgi:hypothetical protein
LTNNAPRALSLSGVQARKSGDIVLKRKLSSVYNLGSARDGSVTLKYAGQDELGARDTPIPPEDLSWGDGDGTGQFALAIKLEPLESESKEPPTTPSTPASSQASDAASQH